ncbi:MAG: 5'-nucleotidase, lipoprotein e(P4) family [Bacteroidales bacterium]|jgi:5'-nucleotidase (lipoprotein e(P4) family)|nr:5'-nucleotidase, lipoprotein e(P4) family [Bacteroidales bacterium]
MQKLLLSLVIAAAFITGCKQNEKKNEDHLLMAVAWYQNSGEMQALYHQAFNCAKYSVDNFTADYTGDKKLAVIVDIDETVLDNSPFEAGVINTNTPYSSETWDAWVNQKRADAVPGAVDFAKYLNQKGVELFYISNRKVHLLESTIANLKSKGFPVVDKEHILLRTEGSGKEPRREVVKKDYDIVLLMGDNLSDFLPIFEDRTNQAKDAVEKYKSEFGKRFIVLPNPMYGEWEGQIYNHNYKLTRKEKNDLLKKSLRD